MRFARSFVINLPFKTDRLDKFMSTAPKCLGTIEAWPAVHGDSIRHPDWWKAGAGAWGCYRSHMQILEYCYQHNVESYVVFEDDAIWRSPFEQLAYEFAADLPDDWEQVYLGGQLLHESQHPPRRITDNVYIPYNVNRTHCFAVHRRGYEILYKHLNAMPFAPNEHIDHHLGRLHESGRLKLYCPGKWLVGQDGGSSNISGHTNGATFWVDPERLADASRKWGPRKVPAVFLEATIEVAVELERRGWHRGKWQSQERLDRGVCSALTASNPVERLHQWYRSVMPEAVREGLKCVCLYHPNLTRELVDKLTIDKFIHIVASSAEEAEAKFAESQLPPSELVQIPEKPASVPCNLIYHIYPKSGNGTWQWNVSQLLRRIDVFDGVRVIAVATDDRSDSFQDVRNAFGDTRIDHWIDAPNDHQLHEVATFKLMLGNVLKQPGYTFYGHAKGVSYDNPEQTREWTQMMYEINLDDIDHVLSTLQVCPTAGAFTNTEWKEGNTHGWHYSGTFFWFRNADVQAQPWPDAVMHSRWGVELWPGSLLPLDQAGVLFGANVGRMYNDGIKNHMAKWLRTWKQSRRASTHQIPIYINARNLLTPLKKMVQYLQQIHEAKIIVVDNDSTWQPLLDWYEHECTVQVIRTAQNGGKFGWCDYLQNGEAQYYVVTDSDLDLAGVPLDVLHVLKQGLDDNPTVSKVGLSLDLESIPSEYKFANDVRSHEAQFWRDKHGLFWKSGIDTTFAMRRASDPIAKETWGHLRADKPYTAVHWPWSWTESVIADSPEIQHYLETATSEGNHWTDKQKREPVR